MKRIGLWQVVGYVVAVVVAAVPFVAIASHSVLGFAGESKPVSVQDLRPMLLDGEWYSESYSFNGWFHDGSRSYIQFIINNIGFGDHKAAATFSFEPAKGKGCSMKLKRTSDQWTNGKGFDLNLGNARLTGNLQVLHLYGKSKNMTIDLTYKNVIPPWKPRSGVVDYGSGRFYKFMLTAPRARVSGSITCRGKVYKLSGIGFGDHSVINFPAYKQAHRYIRLRAYSGDYTVLMSEYDTPKTFGKKRIAWLLLGYKDKVVFESYHYRLIPKQRKMDGEYEIIPEYEILAKSNLLTLKGHIKNTKRLSKYSFLSKMPALERAIVSRFVNPMAYTWRNRFEFEITLANGNSLHFDGEGISEITYVNP